MFVGNIDALCGGLPLVIVHEIAGDRGDAELGTRKRRAGRAVLLLDNQRGRRLVIERERVGDARPNNDALGGVILDVALGGAGFRDDYGGVGL